MGNLQTPAIQWREDLKIELIKLRHEIESIKRVRDAEIK